MKDEEKRGGREGERERGREVGREKTERMEVYRSSNNNYCTPEECGET